MVAHTGIVSFTPGATGSLVFFCYVIFFTIPHWNTLVTQEIAKHRGKTGNILFLYFLFLLAEAAFNLLYFVIIERAGALLAGVLQGLRAVCVFAFSSVFFCHLQHSQCFDLFKALSTLIVVGGVMVRRIDHLSALKTLCNPCSRRSLSVHSLLVHRAIFTPHSAPSPPLYLPFAMLPVNFKHVCRQDSQVYAFLSYLEERGYSFPALNFAPALRTYFASSDQHVRMDCKHACCGVSRVVGNTVLVLPRPPSQYCVDVM